MTWEEATSYQLPVTSDQLPATNYQLSALGQSNLSQANVIRLRSGQHLRLPRQRWLKAGGQRSSQVAQQCCQCCSCNLVAFDSMLSCS